MFCNYQQQSSEDNNIPLVKWAEAYRHLWASCSVQTPFEVDQHAPDLALMVWIERWSSISWHPVPSTGVPQHCGDFPHTCLPCSAAFPWYWDSSEVNPNLFHRLYWCLGWRWDLRYFFRFLIYENKNLNKKFSLAVFEFFIQVIILIPYSRLQNLVWKQMKTSL